MTALCAGCGKTIAVIGDYLLCRECADQLMGGEAAWSADRVKNEEKKADQTAGRADSGS